MIATLYPLVPFQIQIHRIAAVPLHGVSHLEIPPLRAKHCARRPMSPRRSGTTTRARRLARHQALPWESV